MPGIKQSALQRPADKTLPAWLSAARLPGKVQGAGDHRGTGCVESILCGEPREDAAVSGQAKPLPRRCWGEESGRDWRGSLPEEGKPVGADNRVLCSPDESTCPGAGSWPGAPYGGDLPLATAVSSRHRASLARDAATSPERSLGTEPCRMGL